MLLDRSRIQPGSRWTLLVLAAAVGCAKPDAAEIVHPLETTLGAAVPAAYLAAVSMAALDGRSSPCARVVTPAGSGTIRVDVSLGPGCPPMFGADEHGTMVVTGTWTPQGATFLMDFTDVTSGGRPMVVVGIATMTVVPRDATHLVIAFGEEDVRVGTGTATSAGVKQVAWVVNVDTAGTDDPSDDTLAISGGDQVLLAAVDPTPQGGLTQVAVGNAVFEPGCRRNPSSGMAVVQRASTSGGGWVLFGFHAACDGTTDVFAALAPYEPLISDSLPLAFLQK
ncbi:MAG: hypothetical protein ACXWLP_13280 [Myxococcaceae bacterium]